MEFFQVETAVVPVIGAIILILTIATAVYVILNRRRPSDSLSKVGARIWFWWMMAAVFILALIFSVRILLLFVAFMSFLALKEFLSITPSRRADRRVLFGAYLTIPIQYILIWQGWYDWFIVFTPAYIFFILPLSMALIGETKGFLNAYGTLTWGIISTVFFLGHLAYLLVLPPVANPVAGGLGLFLYLVFLTQLNDVAQFTFGRLFGLGQIVPQVSVTRTWVGLAGGIILTALVAALLAPLLTPFTAFEATLIGGLIAVAGFIGYVTLAAIKGDLQLKDRGTMTPGQGGILNRLDSLLFTAPLFLHIVRFLQL